MPNMERLGLGNIRESEIKGIRKVERPMACYSRMQEQSAGKDTMTGHWGMMGLVVDTPFQVFPEGFPKELIEELEGRAGRPVIGNKAASGTDILDELGEEHMTTGALIVYTSADSVLQIAAHEEVVPLGELYDICAVARSWERSDLRRYGSYPRVCAIVGL